MRGSPLPPRPPHASQTCFFIIWRSSLFQLEPQRSTFDAVMLGFQVLSFHSKWSEKLSNISTRQEGQSGVVVTEHSDGRLDCCLHSCENQKEHLLFCCLSKATKQSTKAASLQNYQSLIVKPRWNVQRIRIARKVATSRPAKIISSKTDKMSKQ